MPTLFGWPQPSPQLTIPESIGPEVVATVRVRRFTLASIFNPPIAVAGADHLIGHASIVRQGPVALRSIHERDFHVPEISHGFAAYPHGPPADHRESCGGFQ